MMNILKNNDSRLITDMKEKLLPQTIYIKNLFKDEREELPSNLIEDTGTPILPQEVIYMS